MQRRRIGGLVAAAALAATTVMWAEPSVAATNLLVCTGTATIDYTPPLGPLPRPTTQKVAERLGDQGGGGCVGGKTGGGADTTFQQEVGCLLQGLGDTLVENVVTYHWSDGQTSTITYPVTTVAHLAGQLVVTSTGTVTAGYGQGSASERVAAYPDLDVLACLTSGVSRQTGLLTVTLV